MNGIQKLMATWVLGGQCALASGIPADWTLSQSLAIDRTTSMGHRIESFEG
jgi:hypothetical protein